MIKYPKIDIFFGFLAIKVIPNQKIFAFPECLFMSWPGTRGISKSLVNVGDHIICLMLSPCLKLANIMGNIISLEFEFTIVLNFKTIFAFLRSCGKCWEVANFKMGSAVTVSNQKVEIYDINGNGKKGKKKSRRRPGSNRGPLDPKSAMLAPRPRRLKVF